MRAIVYTAPRELELLETEEPLRGDGEVLVRVRATGICGSEIEGVRSQSPFRVPPLIMGHEFAGERLDTHQRVVINPVVACGECSLCVGGRRNLCRKRQLLGVHRNGGFAERVAVPADRIFPIGDDLTWKQAAIIEPLANALHAWGLAAERSPARVGILGAGPIGILCLLVAQAHGASRIDVADLAEERLAVASSLGASSVGQTLSGDQDVIIDAVGVPTTRRASVECLAPGGAAVWIGLHGDTPAFDALSLIRNEQTVLGSFAYSDDDFQRAIEMAGSIDPFWVQSLPLSDGVAVFEQLMAGRTDILKAVLMPVAPESPRRAEIGGHREGRPA